MIKVVMSKEGVKKILNSHDVNEIGKIYTLYIFQRPGYTFFDGEFYRLTALHLGKIEQLLNEDNVMFIKIDTSDEGMISNKENKEDKDEHEGL